jgi:hypothetical protein
MLYSSEHLNPLYMSSFYIDRDAYDQLASGEIEPSLIHPDVTEFEIDPNIDIADLLLHSVSTAVMHFERPAEKQRNRSSMIAVNYTRGHSEGEGLIVLQDASKPDEGQLEVKVDSGDMTVYRRALGFGNKPYPFEKSPTNPLKIRSYYVHLGEPDEAITSFKARGYEVKDEFRPTTNTYF